MWIMVQVFDGAFERFDFFDVHVDDCVGVAGDGVCGDDFVYVGDVCDEVDRCDVFGAVELDERF